MRGGQSWSIDVIIGVLIFLLVIGVFYALLTNNVRDDTTDLKIASETISAKLTEESAPGIITQDSIDKQKLIELTRQSYQDLKKELGIDTEFCVFFEDEEGNVINITFKNATGNYTYIGIGSRNINISGIPCHET